MILFLLITTTIPIVCINLNSSIQNDHTQSCRNGGIRLTTDGICYCPFATTGVYCELAISCNPDHGILIDDGICKCDRYWMGVFCETRLCYHGIIVTMNESSNCICDLGYSGPFCDRPIICKHGWISSLNQCECYESFMGVECDQCISNYIFDDIDQQCHLDPNQLYQLHILPNLFDQTHWFVVIIIIILLVSTIIVIIILIYSKRLKRRVSNVIDQRSFA